LSAPHESIRMDASQVMDCLRALRRAPKDAQYWHLFAICLAHLCRARVATVLRANVAGAWSVLGTNQAERKPLGAEILERLGTLAPRAQAQGHAYEPQNNGDLVAVVPLLDPDGPTWVLLELSGKEKPAINELLVRAQLVADLPSVQPMAEVESDNPEWVSLLDLVARVTQETEFGAAALSLVNLMAALLPCDQAVLGWCEDGQVQVLAISHIDRFEQQAANVQLLEAALEEAVDQHTDLVFPPEPDDSVVVLAHTRLSRMMGYEHLSTLIVRDEVAGDSPLALLIARKNEGLSADRLHQISVVLHLMKPWLTVLHERSRGWAGHFYKQFIQYANASFSPQSPGRKALVGAAVLALGVVTFGQWPYRIEASGELTTDSVQTISAPFDGYLGKVHFTIGDRVTSGAVLAELDTRDLSLQAQDMYSEVVRYAAEADRARAQNQTADTEIAMARMTQAQARLDRLRFQLQQARITAPFEGVLVEGERKELTGIPIHQGDKIFRLARTEGLYATLHISERDVQALPNPASGRLLLLSQPDQSVPFSVQQVVPVAQVKGSQAGQFLVKAHLDQVAAPWWRPGMSALALIDAGDQPIWWIWVHKWVDNLRMMLWW
jgi:hypothetical protein